MKRITIAAVLLLVASFIPSVQAAPEPSPLPVLPLQGHPSCAGISEATPSTPECDALIAARPTPNVSPIPVDFGIVNGQSFIRFSTSAVPLFDQPEGEVVETMSAGYTYVNVLQTDGDWAEVRPGRWVDLRNARYAQPSTFSGVSIQSMDMPFAWVLWPHCTAIRPNGYQNCEDGGVRIERYQLVNIYATVNIRGWNWHLIGPGMWTNQYNLSIVYPSAPADFGGHWVAVNTYEQNLVAYNGSTPVMATLVSSGMKDEDRWRTHAGTFSVRLMVELGPMNGYEDTEEFYSLDEVPYAMYFNGLVSLHGTYWHDSFGYVHSHGCVNMTISDSKWLYDNWVTEGMTVLVYGDDE
jgi:hypothetical protein